TENSGVTAYDTVRNYWQAQAGKGQDFEKWWRRALNDGFIANSAGQAHAAGAAKTGNINFSPAPTGEIEVVFRPDPAIFGGRYFNNGWLQELPKPVSKLTWDNAAFMSLKTAQSFKGGDGQVGNQDVITIQVGEAR